MSGEAYGSHHVEEKIDQLYNELLAEQTKTANLEAEVRELKKEESFLGERVSNLILERKILLDERDRLLTELVNFAKAKAERDNLLSLLRELEWIDFGEHEEDGQVIKCLVCGYFEGGYGHASTCALGNALKEN